MRGIDDKGKLLEAFQLVFSRTGKTEASMPELIEALREVNPMLRNRSNPFIRKMIESNSPSSEDLRNDAMSSRKKKDGQSKVT